MIEARIQRQLGVRGEGTEGLTEAQACWPSPPTPHRATGNSSDSLGKAGLKVCVCSPGPARTQLLQTCYTPFFLGSKLLGDHSRVKRFLRMKGEILSLGQQLAQRLPKQIKDL